MQFKDCLSTLQYLGYAEPYQVVMASYALYLCLGIKPLLWEETCGEYRFEANKYRDIDVMLVSHISCFLIGVIYHRQNEHSERGSYIQTIIRIIRVIIYFSTLTYVLTNGVN